jgi:uncharacterized protein (TIGR03435 family)
MQEPDGSLQRILRHALEGEVHASRLFTALPDQPGLRLKGTKAAVEVILIDHTDRPTDN